MTRARTLVLAPALALLCAALQASGCLALAHAHATLDRSIPAASAVLASAPRQVDLYFAEPLASAGGQSFAVVLDATGRTVSGAAEGDGADPRHLIVPLAGSLDAGEYTVFWKSDSASDGGTTLGNFFFLIGSAAATPHAANQVLVPDTVRARALSSGSGHNATDWLAGGAIGLAAGLAAGAAFVTLFPRRQQRAPAGRRSAGKRR